MNGILLPLSAYFTSRSVTTQHVDNLFSSSGRIPCVYRITEGKAKNFSNIFEELYFQKPHNSKNIPNREG